MLLMMAKPVLGAMIAMRKSVRSHREKCPKLSKNKLLKPCKTAHDETTESNSPPLKTTEVTLIKDI